MLGRFDFSIPLTLERLYLLYACINRHRELLYANTAELELNRYIARMLANWMFKEPNKILSAVNRHVDFIINGLSDTVFPYDKSKYDEEESDLSELKAQYKRYIENLEKAEKEHKDVSGNR